MTAGAGSPKAPTPVTAPAAEASAASHKGRRLVAEVAQRHFGEKPKKVAARGGGLTNAVYELKLAKGEFIVRTNDDATKIGDYLKEQWAMNAARAAGVPTPHVLEVGNFADGRPYMITEHVPGNDGRCAADRLALLETLGRHAKRLHTVRTRGFGPVFDWSGNRLSRHAGWANWLAAGFQVERRLDVLLRHRMIDRQQLARLRRVAATMVKWRKPAALQHGDLRLKNVLVDPEDGRLVAILDWETAISSPAPFWDLSLALHDLGIDEKEAFLAGYGVKRAALSAALPFIRFFNVLNYAHAIESAAAKKKTDRLEWFRVRLNGQLDLYEG